MKIRRVNAVSPDSGVIAAAAQLLRDGGLVAFPTETVYGLGANATKADAVQKIYDAKGRPAYNPIIVHVASIDAAKGLVTQWNDAADRLAKAFWPGPLTLVLPKKPVIPDIVTAGSPTVGVRVPSHPVAQALLRACECPVAAPSANRSTMLSPTTGAHVEHSLADAVDMILDCGPTPVGIESTVVDVSSETPAVLRPGMITRSELEAVVGPVREHRSSTPETGVLRAPGMMSVHYAPRARLMLVDAGDIARVAHDLGQSSDAARVGVLTITQHVESIGSMRVIRLPDTAIDYAKRLYAVLHELDAVGCDTILVEPPPHSEEWVAIRDRLSRAAARHE